MKPAMILVVEDEESLRMALADNLEDEGYQVRSAATGAEAMAACAGETFGLVILDVMLPDMDGYAICRKLREAGCAAMIMMLTARSLEEDIVKGFDAGADDYLCKPYRLRELISRVRALLRRGDAAAPGPLAFAGFRMDPASRSVHGPEGEPVEFTKTEFDLLWLMLKFRGQALPRQRILDEVWGQDVVVDARTVDNFVSSIKRKLGWSGSSGFRIVSLRGIGYRFEVKGD